MNFPADFPITKKWPAKFPDRIQLYSLPTPNGVKASTMLEETGLPYEPHTVSFDRNDQTSPEFLSLNPNNKIPAIIDPVGPGGRPLPLVRVRRDPRFTSPRSRANSCPPIRRGVTRPSSG